jgi:hypothetical protein
VVLPQHRGHPEEPVSQITVTPQQFAMVTSDAQAEGHPPGNTRTAARAGRGFSSTPCLPPAGSMSYEVEK